MDINFKGKKAIVTGAGRGIGKAVALKLCELGASVVAVSKSQATLDQLKSEQPNIRCVQVDLGNWKETIEKLKPIVQEGVDLLVNNAGFAQDLDIGQIDEPAIDAMFNVNYKACLNLIQMCSEGMKAQKSGSIVNVSSVSGMVGLKTHAVYGATKGALDLLTKVTTQELAKYNIRCNSVNPTVVWTDMGAKSWQDETKKAEMLAKIPANRFAEVAEVVHAIMFLLSDYSLMINGITLPIDGGFVAT